MSDAALTTPFGTKLETSEEPLALDLAIQVIEYPLPTMGPVAGGSDYLTCKEEESTCDGSDAC